MVYQLEDSHVSWTVVMLLFTNIMKWHLPIKSIVEPVRISHGNWYAFLSFHVALYKYWFYVAFIYATCNQFISCALSKQCIRPLRSFRSLGLGLGLASPMGTAASLRFATMPIGEAKPKPKPKLRKELHGLIQCIQCLFHIWYLNVWICMSEVLQKVWYYACLNVLMSEYAWQKFSSMSDIMHVWMC